MSHGLPGRVGGSSEDSSDKGPKTTVPMKRPASKGKNKSKGSKGDSENKDADHAPLGLGEEDDDDDFGAGGLGSDEDAGGSDIPKDLRKRPAAKPSPGSKKKPRKSAKKNAFGQELPYQTSLFLMRRFIQTLDTTKSPYLRGPCVSVLEENASLWDDAMQVEPLPASRNVSLGTMCTIDSHN